MLRYDWEFEVAVLRFDSLGILGLKSVFSGALRHVLVEIEGAECTTALGTAELGHVSIVLFILTPNGANLVACKALDQRELVVPWCHSNWHEGAGPLQIRRFTLVEVKSSVFGFGQAVLGAE